MGIIGRYLDSLTDEQRDRVIQHPDPTHNGRAWHNGTCGCLVGEAEEAPDGFRDIIDWSPAAKAWYSRIVRIPYARAAGHRFPRLTNRVGAPEAWRIVKARAARRNTPSLSPDRPSRIARQLVGGVR